MNTDALDGCVDVQLNFNLTRIRCLSWINSENDALRRRLNGRRQAVLHCLLSMADTCHDTPRDNYQQSFLIHHYPPY